MFQSISLTVARKNRIETIPRVVKHAGQRSTLVNIIFVRALSSSCIDKIDRKNLEKHVSIDDRESR